eukprot:4345124-Heterocapsa_arctica.AAC.1
MEGAFEAASRGTRWCGSGRAAGWPPMDGAFGLRIEWATSSGARKFQSPVTMRQNFKGRAAARAASAESAV